VSKRMRECATEFCHRQREVGLKAVTPETPWTTVVEYFSLEALSHTLSLSRSLALSLWRVECM
jgi:hypothetical protein